ncbi:MAG: hypothetical protein AMXMBFR66_30240 [Pseudomonadota bacterium]|nr:hypothetical protein [Rubrivivax sp.]
MLESFRVTALQWTSSVRLSRLVGDGSAPAPKPELGQLALVGLPPFTTALMGQQGKLGSAAALYSGHLCALALLTAARVALALPAPCADVATAQARRQLLTRAWLTVACTALALALAHATPGWNMLALLPLALYPRVQRVVSRRRPQHPQPEQGRPLHCGIIAAARRASDAGDHRDRGLRFSLTQAIRMFDRFRRQPSPSLHGRDMPARTSRRARAAGAADRSAAPGRRADA